MGCQAYFKKSEQQIDRSIDGAPNTANLGLRAAHGATTTGFAGRQSCMGVRGVCVRIFFQPAQSNFGKSEAISYSRGFGRVQGGSVQPA
jgi:hypothetical protein